VIDITSVSQNRKPRNSWSRAFGLAFVFVVFGPPIGGLVFWVSGCLVELPISKLGSTIFEALFFIPFTYSAGFWPAAVAGALLALAYSQFARVGLVTALGIGILVGLGFMAVNGGDSVPLPGDPGQRTMPAHPVVILLANALPTLVLWFVTRNWFGQTTQSKEMA
jgi:hypothetical protein